MKLAYTCITRVAIGVLVASLSGCDLVYECLSDTRLKFDETSLDVATLNQTYSESIRASIKNNLFDDSYDYEFKITDGTLPEGITGFGLERRFYFEGTPTELGSFDFTLQVSINENDNYYDDDSDAITCNDVAEQRLTLTVEEATE